MVQSSRPSVPPLPPLPVPPLSERSESVADSTQFMAAPPTLSPQRSPAPAPAAPPPPAQRAAAPQTTGRSPDQPSLAQLIQMAFEEGYSDVHLGVGEAPRMRDRGEMMVLNYPEVDLATFMSWMREIMSEDEIQRFQRDLEFDGATQYDFARVRINIFGSLRGPAMVLRLIPLKILTMEQLRLPDILRTVSDAHKGLILVTGPTGSGKSTTMAAMVDYINKEHAKHIITIEDPIEFV
ncbi:MAG: type IV pilus twitching motility protein PilT, partial [Microcystaceae cyanobacterium]